MLAGFEQSVKQSMAEAAGPDVSPLDVEVKLKAGSVVVDGKISPPPGVTADQMDKNIENGAANVAARMVARVKALPGIDTIALGDITCDKPKVHVVHEVAPTTTTTTTPPP